MRIFRKWAGGKPNPKCTRMENHIDAIIDEETWEKVEKRMSDNKRNAANKAKREYLLSGLIHCEKCGATYVGCASVNKKGYEYRSYACGNKKRTHACDAKNIPANDIETFVVAHINDYLSNADYEALGAEIARQFNGASPDLSEEKAELAQIDTQINNGVKAVLSGITIPELEQELDRLRGRKSELEDIIRETQKSRKKLDPEVIANRLRNYASMWVEGRKQEVVRDLVKANSNADGTITVCIGVADKNGCGGGI